MNSIFAGWISAYLIYGDPVVCLFSEFRFSQIYIFLILFSFYRPPKDRTKLALNLDSWKTIYLKIIALFLSFFFMYNFHLSLAARCCFVGQQKHFFDFFFLNWFYMGFSPLFSGAFFNVICYSKRMEILLYLVSFVLWSKKLTRFCLFNFWSFSRGKEKI